jgi:beta-lactamase regulating signal transducer with metallopeptidase domain/tetratricopeptide (TPR) repeat protein
MTTLLEIGLINAVLATLLALGVWLATQVWRQPVLGHALWILVLAKLVTPPMIGIPWKSAGEPISSSALAVAPSPASPSTQQLAPTPVAQHRLEMGESKRRPQNRAASLEQTAPTIDELPLENPSSHHIDWSTTCAMVWLTGIGTFVAVIFVRLARFHRALAAADAAPRELEELAAGIAGRFGIRNYQLRVTEGRLTPLVWPIGRPTIVFSRRLLAQLSPDETQTLLAHELAHLRRKDHWVRWLELTAVTLYWWHPVAWWARSMIRRTEEQACDAWVAWALPDAARRYASALFTTVEFVSAARPAAPIVASRLDAGGNLKERIDRIMSAKIKHRLSLPVRIMLVLLACVILPLSLQTVRAADEPARPDNEPVDTSPSKVLAHPSGTNRSGNQKRTLDHRLDARVKVNFLEIPLAEALHSLSNEVGADIYLDPSGLSQEGIDSDEPVTLDLKNEVSLRSALNLLLKPLNLMAVVEDEVIKVTSQAEQHQTPITEGTYQIALGDVLQVTAVGIAPEDPIADIFAVEPGGTLPLGPRYGRVKVAGLTLAQAEKATRDLLKKDFQDPKVQITLGWQQQKPVASDGGGDLTEYTSQQQSIATQPYTTAAGAPGPNEVEVLRQHVAFLEQRFKVADAKFRTGSRGGEQDVRDMTGYELTTAKAQLALAEGRHDAAEAHFKEAEKFAESGLKAVEASYDAGRVTNDLVLQAANNLAESKRRLLHFRRQSASTETTPQPTTEEVYRSSLPRAGLTFPPANTPSIQFAKRQVEIAKADYERMQSLAQRNVVSESELEHRKLDYERSVEQLRRSERALEYNKLSTWRKPSISKR